MEIEIVTPTGRKRYLDILYKNLLLQKKDFNQWTLWINTTNQEDIEYAKDLEKKHDWIKTIDPILIPNGGWSVHAFYKHACDPNKIYIKMDDDLVWLENNFIKNLVNFRKENPEYFLVYGNIINNAIIDHIHQRFGALNIPEIIGYSCGDHFGWGVPEIAEKKHNNLINSIINDDLNKFKFNKNILFYFERVSINCISWFGSEFKKFDGNVGHDDEQWLSHDYPKDNKKFNIICGNSLCSHFAFFTQREYLDKTNILDKYSSLINFKSSFNIGTF